MQSKRVIALIVAAVVLTVPPGVAAARDQVQVSAPHGCVSKLGSGTTTVQMQFGGVGYPVRIHVPAERAAAVPMIVDLHPSNGNAEGQARYNGFDALADQEGFVTVRPNGAIPAATPNPNRVWFWNVPNVPTVAGEYPPPDARDDIGYLTTVIKQATELVCADRRRVFMTGFSGGARMTSAFACARPELVAAIAPVAGLRAGRPAPDDPSVPDLASCVPRKPVPVISFHGTADGTNPYAGNSDLRWGYTVPLAAQTWARLNGCTRGPTARQVTDHVTVLSYSRCDDHATVNLYRVTGGTHSWPGSTDPNATQEISANQLTWDFFSRH